MRYLAQKCNISVGCIYNYFANKSELILCITEIFWQRIFHSNKIDKELSFTSCISEMYIRLFDGFAEFENMLSVLTSLSDKERLKGKGIEQKYMSHIKQGLLFCLDTDKKVNLAVFNEKLTKEGLVDYVFDNIMLSLASHKPSCDTLCQILELVLY